MEGCIYVHTAPDSYIDDFSQEVLAPAMTVAEYTAGLVELLNSNMHDGGKTILADAQGDGSAVIIHTREISTIEIEEDPEDGDEPVCFKISYDAFSDEFWCMQTSHVLIPTPPLRDEDCH